MDDQHTVITQRVQMKSFPLSHFFSVFLFSIGTLFQSIDSQADAEVLESESLSVTARVSTSLRSGRRESMALFSFRYRLSSEMARTIDFQKKPKLIWAMKCQNQNLPFRAKTIELPASVSFENIRFSVELPTISPLGVGHCSHLLFRIQFFDFSGKSWIDTGSKEREGSYTVLIPFRSEAGRTTSSSLEIDVLEDPHGFLSSQR